MRFDAGWKHAVRTFLPECLQLLFPDLHAQIDWSRGYQVLHSELLRPVPFHGAARRFVDVLVRVYFQDGRERFVLLHIEIQAQRTRDFPLQMFIYHYRIFDAYDCPDLISLAILADNNPNWRPDTYERALGGCEVRFRFPIVKLIDFDEAELESSDNPFALIVLAHLRALKARGNPELLLREKFALIREIARRGYTTRQVIDLFRVVDYLMNLTKMRNQVVRDLIRRLEAESDLPLTSLEELALEEGVEKGLRQGLQQGLQQGQRQGLVRAIVRVLQARFGEDARRLQERIEQIESLELLESLNAEAALAPSIEAFEQKLD
ncbi:MAG: hypothetical protein WHS44_12645 [Fimbriimonadales bacterium]|nr:MAG: hypothetical protein KatS3mg018_1442 [Fimbriimonadales bacterium]